MEDLKPKNFQEKTQPVHSLTLVLAIYFLHLSPQARETKAKINKQDYIKRKFFYTAKKTVNKRPPTEWEKIFVNDIFDKGLISKIYKELTRLNIKKTNKQHG